MSALNAASESSCDSLPPIADLYGPLKRPGLETTKKTGARQCRAPVRRLGLKKSYSLSFRLNVGTRPTSPVARSASEPGSGTVLSVSRFLASMLIRWDGGGALPRTPQPNLSLRGPCLPVPGL
jgi:hypothetical protein